MAEFNLNSISIIFDGGRMSRIDASFNKRDTGRRNNINGNVELSVQEYLENMTDDLLIPLVQQKAVDFIQGTNDEEEPPQDMGEGE